jgi:hypothetical protein
MNIAPVQANRRIFLRSSSQAALFLTAADAANAMPTTGTEPQPSLRSVLPVETLAELSQRLASAPRGREFSSVPFVLTSRDMWDHEAASEVLSYKFRSLQMWECTDLAAP